MSRILTSLTLADLAGLVIEARNGLVPSLLRFPENAPFRAYFWQNKKDMTYHFSQHVVFTKDPRYLAFIREQFPSITRRDASVYHYNMDARDYAKMRLIFGGQE